MSRRQHWSLGTKLALVGAPFLLLALLSAAATLWVSWQLDGGAAATNEAGRLRMQTYRLALAIETNENGSIAQQVLEFEKGLVTLRDGDAERPLFVPWDNAARASFDLVEQDWRGFKARWIEVRPDNVRGLTAETVVFSNHIDTFVLGIESQIAHWTTTLHLLQMSMLVMAVTGAAVLLFTGYLFVLEPVGQLKQAIEKIQSGDFNARVDRVTSDEFGTLAEGFNDMAEHMQSMYRNLEHKVSEKTFELQEKNDRLKSLFEVNELVAKSTNLDELAQGFVKSIASIAHADGVALRWSDQDNQRYLMLAAHGLPQIMVDEEQCLNKGDCHCGSPTAQPGMRVIPIQNLIISLKHCTRAGFKTMVSIPLQLHDRLMGEVDLFFHAVIEPSQAERSLLEALCGHLASGVENLRLNSLEKEAAISQERHLLARELHDSIAQSLVFIKIQVQLMRDAVQLDNTAEVKQVLEEIDVGVRECYGDVRELLLHFRTRTNTEDIEPALATTLRKFEHQSGLKSSFSMQGQGMPLSPDLQIQALHIVQEALSNVRKHARASQVWLDVQQQPAWRFEVRDDGVGFKPDNDQLDETHVGLRIMTERAHRIGAELEVISVPGMGSSVILTLQAPLPAMPASRPMNLSPDLSQEHSHANS